MATVGDDQVPIRARIRELVAERSDESFYTVVDTEGGDTSFTWAELDRRSGQVGPRSADVASVRGGP